MRISELSRASGVSIPTLKFYLREKLLPAGTRTAPNQADYSDGHLRRLRLIQALTEVGGLSLKQVGAVLDAIDDENRSTHELLGVAHRALGPHPVSEDGPDFEQASLDVDRFLLELGWEVGAGAPARNVLAGALVTLWRMGREAEVEAFEPYARAVEGLAAREVGTVSASASRAEQIEGLVIGTVVFEAALVALRRLAQEHHSFLRFAGTQRPV
ncbi:MAG TPA: MerR family transcriptional regulator [Actinomycetota bacterium]|nr:MerR family transcriptional regulator [Actinomycetota bacterium]